MAIDDYDRAERVDEVAKAKEASRAQRLTSDFRNAMEEQTKAIIVLRERLR